MRIAVTKPAPEHHVFGPGVFDRSVGSTVPLTDGDAVIGHAVVVSAAISADGSEALLTLDVSDEVAEMLTLRGTAYSVAADPTETEN